MISIEPPLTPGRGTGHPRGRDGSVPLEALAVGAGALCRSKGNTALPLTRRQFIRTGGAALATAALTARLQAGYANLKIGAPDWNLKLEAKPASIELAKSIGFDGVQISLGHSSDSKNTPAHLPVSTPDLLDQFVTEARKNQLPIASTCVEILHRNYLKNDPLGKQWVAESIQLTRSLGLQVILLRFFGKEAYRTVPKLDAVVVFVNEW